MNSFYAWEQIRKGDGELGLTLLRQSLTSGPLIEDILELGLAYLLLDEYDAAWEHFESVIKSNPQSPAKVYGMAGVAKWCLKSPESATAAWTAGLGTLGARADKAGLRLSLLMFAASIAQPGDIHHKYKAWAALLPKLDRLVPDVWPNQLVEYAIGIRGQEQLPETLAGSSGGEMHDRQWLCDFYKAVGEFHLIGDPRQFDPVQKADQLKERMQHLVDTTRSELVEITAFKSLIAHEEFYVARFLARAPLELPTAPAMEVDWENLRYGDGKLGLELRIERFLRKPSPAHTLGLGIAYLWTKDYESAWSLFQYANRNSRLTSQSSFGMAGAAKWCLDQHEEAVDCWKAGLQCNYGDAGGASVGNRLLLFAASILRENVFSKVDAIALLAEKADDYRIRAWPGPLVAFCLQKAVIPLDLAESKPGIETRRAQLSFYSALLAFEAGALSREELNNRMIEIADTSGQQWTEQNKFSSLIRSEEFFIARHESSP